MGTIVYIHIRVRRKQCIRACAAFVTAHISRTTIPRLLRHVHYVAFAVTYDEPSSQLNVVLQRNPKWIFNIKRYMLFPNACRVEFLRQIWSLLLIVKIILGMN